MMMFFLAAIAGSIVLKTMDVSKSLNVGEQIMFNILNTNIVKITKGKTSVSKELFNNIVINETLGNKCYPNEEYLYKKIENLVEFVDNSIKF